MTLPNGRNERTMSVVQTQPKIRPDLLVAAYVIVIGLACAAAGCDSGETVGDGCECGVQDTIQPADIVVVETEPPATALPVDVVEAEPAPIWPVQLGIDRLLDEETGELELLRGKRIGLITNPSGVDGDLMLSADRLAEDPRVELVRLFAPEHGIRGSAAAGRKLDDLRDEVTGLPVVSLYGKKRRSPRPKTLRDLDALVFDIQDVGSRAYTYTATMAHAMKAAANAEIKFVVLDRPNPIGGELVEGPIREKRHKSFVSFGPTPVSHGMTVGELARFYNEELAIGVDLHVVEMAGWTRSMHWRDTGLRWVPTSPNVPHAASAELYIATGMVAGVTKNVDESANYTMPFETIAAEFIDGRELARVLNASQLGGVHFRPITYQPRGGRFEGDVLTGVHLMPGASGAGEFRPLRTALAVFVALHRLYPGAVEFRSRKSVARIWGNTRVQKMIEAGATVSEIEESWEAELVAYKTRRAKYLLYP